MLLVKSISSGGGGGLYGGRKDLGAVNYISILDLLSLRVRELGGDGDDGILGMLFKNLSKVPYLDKQQNGKFFEVNLI